MSCQPSCIIKLRNPGRLLQILVLFGCWRSQPGRVEIFATCHHCWQGINSFYCCLAVVFSKHTASQAFLFLSVGRRTPTITNIKSYLRQCVFVFWACAAVTGRWWPPCSPSLWPEPQLRWCTAATPRHASHPELSARTSCCPWRSRRLVGGRDHAAS